MLAAISRRWFVGGAAATPALATFSAGCRAADPARLDGRSILITGAASGFGNLGALHYARLGAKVIATMRNLPRPEAEALARTARDEKLDITIVEIDVLDDSAVARGVAEHGDGLERLARGANEPCSTGGVAAEPHRECAAAVRPRQTDFVPEPL